MAIQEPKNQTPSKRLHFLDQHTDNQVHKFHIKIGNETFCMAREIRSVEKIPH